jgi:hypothetical protein
MMRNRALLLAVAVLVIGGGVFRFRPGRSGTPAAGKGQLAVTWYGSTRGKMVMPATLRWCPVTHVALLEAVSQDSGVAVVFFERDALTAGVHPVVDAQLGSGAPRPAATMALRWLRAGNDTTVYGLRSLSGTTQLRLDRNMASGEGTLRLHAVNGADTAVVKLLFRDVPVVATAALCT